MRKVSHHTPRKYQDKVKDEERKAHVETNLPMASGELCVVADFLFF